MGKILPTKITKVLLLEGIHPVAAEKFKQYGVLNKDLSTLKKKRSGSPSLSMNTEKSKGLPLSATYLKRSWEISAATKATTPMKKYLKLMTTGI